MKNAIKLTLTAFVVILSGSHVFSQSASEIADKASKAIDFPSMEMSSTLKIYDAKENKRVRQLVTATKKFNGVSKTIMKFTAPADVKGTTMLIFDNETEDDDMWIYMPALRKTRRIVSSEKSKSFMGSEFANSDMGRPNMDDFNYKILKEEMINGKACWVIEATCKDEDIEDSNGFIRQVSWIEKGTYLCHKVEYYDLDDELHKIQYIKDYRKQSGGGYFAFYLEKENAQNGRKSILIIDKFQESCSMSENSFSPNLFGK
jgi:outer membrane lipoprotein-sorting protein